MVFIIDLSGVIQEMESIMSKWLGVKAHIPKPFSCSLCMTWWTGLIYTLIVNPSLMLVIYTALIAYLTPVIGSVMMLMKDLMVKAIDAVYDLFKL